MFKTSEAQSVSSSLLVPQTVVPGNRNNAQLQNLFPDTPYNITVEAIYGDGPGGSLNGNGRTGDVPVLLTANTRRLVDVQSNMSRLLSRPAESQKPPRVRRVVHSLPSVLGPGDGTCPGIQTDLLAGG